MKPPAIVVLMTCLAVPSLHAQTPSQARAFLDATYAWDTNDDADDPLADAKVYSPSLIRMFDLDRRRAHGDVGRLDFDPLCECQDPGGVRYQINSITSSGVRKADAEVSLNSSQIGVPWRKTLRFDLVWTKHGWRIDDVHTERTASLRRFLAGN